jgi:RNA polymerase sigma factor (sigma-70 family)
MRIAQQSQADPVVANASLEPRLCAAISELSNDDRELLLLVAWDELRPSEAAVVLGISSEAARSRLHRARRRMDTALQLQEVHDEPR